MKEVIKFANGEEAWKFIDVPAVNESTGTLKVVEYGAQLDFEVKRVFYLCDIDIKAARGFHAHEELQQFIFCVAGSFDLVLENGVIRKTYHITPQSPGVWIDGKVWREMHSFSQGSVMMVLCDKEYRFDTVVRDYELFKQNVEVV